MIKISLYLHLSQGYTNYHNLFRFPANGDRRKTWCAALAIDPTSPVMPKFALLYSNHFDESSYFYKRDGKKYLYPDAVPKVVEAVSVLSR